MRVELYIMRCKIEHLEALKDKLEHFLASRGVCVVEKSQTIMNVYVYEQKESELFGVIVFNGLDAETKTITFSF